MTCELCEDTGAIYDHDAPNSVVCCPLCLRLTMSKKELIPMTITVEQAREALSILKLGRDIGNRQVAMTDAEQYLQDAKNYAERARQQIPLLHIGALDYNITQIADYLRTAATNFEIYLQEKERESGPDADEFDPFGPEWQS